MLTYLLRWQGVYYYSNWKTSYKTVCMMRFCFCKNICIVYIWQLQIRKKCQNVTDYYFRFVGSLLFMNIFKTSYIKHVTLLIIKNKIPSSRLLPSPLATTLSLPFLSNLEVLNSFNSVFPFLSSSFSCQLFAICLELPPSAETVLTKVIYNIQLLIYWIYFSDLTKLLDLVWYYTMECDAFPYTSSFEPQMTFS